MRPSRLLSFALVLACLQACSQAASPSAPLSHDAYVWQRNWTGPVQDAVANLSGELTGIRVLMHEVTGSSRNAVWHKVNLKALVRSARPVIAVVRVNGSRIAPSLSLEPVLTRVESWRRSGVNVIGIEIDHDSATNHLADYAAWLEDIRLPTSLRLSITALPTWTQSKFLGRLSNAVDEIVLQVHAIRAPRIFDPEQARIWVHRFAWAVGPRPFQVALPTYRVEIEGTVYEANANDVQSFLALLEANRAPGLKGVVWFRLPVTSDDTAWSASTLRAVITGQELGPDVQAKLVADGPLLFNVVLENRGSLDGGWPGLTLHGDIEAADLTSGYVRSPQGWTAPKRNLQAGDERTVGWVRGKDISIHVN